MQRMMQCSASQQYGSKKLQNFICSGQAIRAWLENCTILHCHHGSGPLGYIGLARLQLSSDYARRSLLLASLEKLLPELLRLFVMPSLQIHLGNVNRKDFEISSRHRLQERLRLVIGTSGMLQGSNLQEKRLGQARRNIQHSTRSTHLEELGNANHLAWWHDGPYLRRQKIEDAPDDVAHSAWITDRVEVDGAQRSGSDVSEGHVHYHIHR